MTRVRIQAWVALLVALTVLIICVSPLAFSLPTPHQKHVRSSPLPTLALMALVSASTLCALSTLFAIIASKPTMFVSERLALICVRLC